MIQDYQRTTIVSIIYDGKPDIFSLTSSTYLTFAISRECSGNLTFPSHHRIVLTIFHRCRNGIFVPGIYLFMYLRTTYGKPMVEVNMHQEVPMECQRCGKMGWKVGILPYFPGVFTCGMA